MTLLCFDFFLSLLKLFLKLGKYIQLVLELSFLVSLSVIKCFILLNKNGAVSFNNLIDSWNVSKVTDLYDTFDGAYAFNQPLGSWDVSQVTRLYQTFGNARAFNQDIGSWNGTHYRRSIVSHTVLSPPDPQLPCACGTGCFRHA